MYASQVKTRPYFALSFIVTNIVIVFYFLRYRLYGGSSTRGVFTLYLVKISKKHFIFVLFIFLFLVHYATLHAGDAMTLISQAF